MKHKIGTEKGTQQEVLFEEPHHANMLFTGITQTGKSSLAMILLAILGLFTNRTVIIFDHYGQWRGIQFINHKSKDSKFALPWIKYHAQIKFKPQDMNTKSLWTSIGIANKSAALCALVANNTKTKEEFYQKINALANHKKLHAAIRGNLEMIGTNDYLFSDFSHTKYILDEVKPGSWNIFYTGNMPDMKLYVGKMLQLLLSEEQIKRLKPVVVIEEASRLCPSMEKIQSYSTMRLIEACTQYMRWGLVLIFICQNPSQIHSTILQNIHHHFSTYCKEIKETHSLSYNYKLNQREFWWKETGIKKETIFIPADSPCDTRQNPFN